MAMRQGKCAAVKIVAVILLCDVLWCRRVKANSGDKKLRCVRPVSMPHLAKAQDKNACSNFQMEPLPILTVSVAAHR